MSAARLNYYARMCAVIKARRMLAFPTLQYKANRPSLQGAETLVDRKHFVLIFFHINIQKQTIKGLWVMQNRAPRRYSLNSFCCLHLLIWWMLLSNALNTYIISVHDLGVTEITAVDGVTKESFVFKQAWTSPQVLQNIMMMNIYSFADNTKASAWSQNHDRFDRASKNILKSHHSKLKFHRYVLVILYSQIKIH